MKRMLTTLLALLLLCAGLPARAESAYAALPWGMTWDTTLAEYIRLLPESEEAYVIIEHADGTYQVDLNAAEGAYYRAMFSGPSLTGKLSTHTLEELADQPMKLEWLAVDESSITTAEPDWDALLDDYMAHYQQFRLAYGPETEADSYVATRQSEKDDFAQRPLPRTGEGLLDGEAARALLPSGDLGRQTWLVAGNGHASCRLYFYATTEEDGRTLYHWHRSDYFTREAQEKIR